MPKGRKKGTPKTGGRKKGTPNRATTISQQLGLDLKKDAIIPILKIYMFGAEIPKHLAESLMIEHLLKAEPKDALGFVEKMMQYVLPKMQATSVDVTTESRKTIEDTLIQLSEEPDEA